MFQNWLKALNKDEFLGKPLKKYQFGEKIQLHSKKMPKLNTTRIALIGVGEGADHIRRELYQMSAPFSKNKIVDLGNVRKEAVSFVIPLLKELLESKIIPIILAEDPRFFLAQYKAQKSVQSLINFVSVDEQFRFDPEEKDKKRLFLNEILEGKRSKLFNAGFIGPQTHFIQPSLFDYLSNRNFDCVRLGNAKSNINELEPIIRDGDLMSFNLSALKRTEAPEQSTPSPSGFTVEEACQICRYAGMSDKLKSFGIYAYESLTPACATAQGIAQMIWYFIDGYFGRKQDYPVTTAGLTEYIVDFKGFDTPLTFWKSKKSGRWWMQVQVKTSKKYLQHRLIPCSYNDYRKACQEELSDRLFNAYKRFL